MRYLESLIIIIIVFAVCTCSTSPDLTKISTNRISQNSSANSIRQDVWNSLRKELCPPIVQTLAKSCKGICCGRQQKKIISMENDEDPLVNIQLICRSDTHLVVNWTSHNFTQNSIFLAEMNEKFVLQSRNLSEKRSRYSYVVTHKNFAVFYNLTQDSNYSICINSFDPLENDGKKLGCDEFTTLPKNYKLLPVVHIYLDSLILVDNKHFEATIKWNPGEDRTCYYEVAVFNDVNYFEQIDVQMPKDDFNVTLYDFAYDTRYKVKITGTTLEKDRETEHPAYFSISTPSCMKIHNSLKMCAPASPYNLTVLESISKKEDPDKIYYDLLITWNSPEFTPNNYKIQIRNGQDLSLITTMTVSGNYTEAYFEAIPLSTKYDIVMVAISPGGTSKPARLSHSITIHKTQKPNEESSNNALWTILIPILLFICVFGSVVITYCRHARALSKRRRDYYLDYDKKMTKDIDSKSGFAVQMEDDRYLIFPSEVVLSEKIGEGAFGIVRKGWMPEKSKKVAVKMLKGESSHDEVKQFQQEIDMMKSVGIHPNIVSLVGYYTKPNSPMMLIVEYCPCGDLLQYLRDAWDQIIYKSSDKPLPMSDMIIGPPIIPVPRTNYAELLKTDYFDVTETLTELPQKNFVVNKLYDINEKKVDSKDSEKEDKLTTSDLLSFSRQIAMGMEYLSSNRVVHRDLAARNVLVCSDKTVKISDFGLSRDIYRENIYKKYSVGKLPIKWMALESLTHQVYTTQSDVWSYGILLWEIVTLGGNPYPDIQSDKILQMLKNGYRMECPTNCSQELYSLMLGCWQARPKDRPNFNEIRQIIDSLIEKMSTHTYMTMDLNEYKQMKNLETYNMSEFTKYKDSISPDRDGDSERYVKPISVKNNRFGITSNEMDNSCNEPFVTENSEIL